MFFFKKRVKEEENNTFSLEQVELINQLSQEISSSLNVDEILQNSVDSIATVLNLHGCILFLIDKNQSNIYTKTISQSSQSKIALKLLNLTNFFEKLKVSLNVKDNLVVDTVLNNRINFNNDLSKFTIGVISSELVKYIQRITFTNSIVTFPIKYKNETIGALLLTSKDKSESFSRYSTLIQAYCSQLGIAINNAAVYAESKTRIELITSQNRDLQSLFTLTSNITKTLDPDRVTQTAVDSLPQSQDMLGGLIMLIDEKEQLLRVKTISTNRFSTFAKDIIGDVTQFYIDLKDPAMHQNPSYLVVSTTRPHFTNDLAESASPPIPASVVPMLQKFANLSSIAEYPLFARGKVIGTIAYFLRNLKAEELDDNIKQLMATYSLQIGIALENALLFKRSQEIQASLQLALNELNEARRRERDMIDVMGHELRTPISIVRNAILVLKGEYEEKKDIVDKDRLGKYLEMAAESVRREITLIETMLAATKIEGNRIQLKYVNVDLLDVINDSLEAHRLMAEQKNLVINYEKPEKEIHVYADRVRAQEIMDNFFSNAIKYTAQGSVTIKVYTEDGYGRIDITDTGIGISEDNLQKLGKKFFRAQQILEGGNFSVLPGGTGLGLFVTFELIRIMSGKRFITSKVGEGSTFSFALPLFTNQEEKSIDQTFMEEEKLEPAA